MNQRPPRDLTEVLFIGAGVLFCCTGVFYMAGGLTCLVTIGRWPRSPWIDALKVVFHPGDPAVAFGLTTAQFGPAAYWTALAVVVAAPVAVGLLGARLWQGRRTTAASQRRA